MLEDFRDMLNFVFLAKGLGILSASYFVHDSHLLMIYSINWPNFIVWFPLLSLDIGQHLYRKGWNVINFEINPIFLIKIFLYMTKKSRQNFGILRTKRTFKVK